MFRQERDDIQYLGRSSFTVLPDTNISGSMGESTPRVANIEFLVLSNTSPQDITNFIGGGDGQSLTILGDGQSTLKNNSTIVTRSGADTLLGVHIYRLVYYNGVWYE